MSTPEKHLEQAPANPIHLKITNPEILSEEAHRLCKVLEKLVESNEYLSHLFVFSYLLIIIIIFIIILC